MYKGIKRIIINKKKRGFTLIELLAVIVMIAIIMVITIPTILNSMSSSKQKAFNTAAEAIKKHLFSNYEACKLGNTDLVNYDTAIFNSECNLYGEDLSRNLILNSGYSFEDIEDVVIGGKNGDYQIRVIANKTGKFGNVEDYTSGNVVYRQWSLNGGDPDLSNGLIPVVYDENEGYWKVANISNKWYNYSKKDQWWANAVSVHTDKRSEYFFDPDDETSYRVGQEINNEDLLAMFVWIPRFSYTIRCTNTLGCLGYEVEGASNLTTNTPGAIDIKFDSVELIDNTYDGNTPTYTYTNDNREPKNWYTHPAFNVNGTQLSGIWVGKFETSVEQNSDCYTGLENPNGDIVKSNCLSNNVNPIILPNVFSLVNVDIKEQFLIAKKFSANNNIYGLTEDSNSHMMKNSEWAAVAYLSQSEYGKYGNNNFTDSNKRIYRNNSGNDFYWARLTGKSSGKIGGSFNPNGTYSYSEDLYGIGASTTGNIYGIYDMVGGASEYMAACYADTCSIFDDDTKYYDDYSSISNVGHALDEVNSWYGVNINVPSNNNPFVTRGSYFRINDSSIFYFERKSDSSADQSSSFRVVLSK